MFSKPGGYIRGEMKSFPFGFFRDTYSSKIRNCSVLQRGAGLCNKTTCPPLSFSQRDGSALHSAPETAEPVESGCVDAATVLSNNCLHI